MIGFNRSVFFNGKTNDKERKFIYEFCQYGRTLAGM